MTKVCTWCKKTKDIQEYYFDRKKGRHIARCRECWKAFMRPRCKKHYEANKKDYQKRARANAKKVSAVIQQYKIDNPLCADCKLPHPPYRLDFDHLPGYTKIANLSRVRALGWGLEKLYEEINKCELVCANCHRDRTFSKERR